MANENKDFDLGFTPDEWEQIQPDQGVGFRRIKYGDYTFEIVGAGLQASKGKKPHNMLKVTSRVIAIGEGSDKAEIGSEITSFYAGSPQSPDFMKKRLKALCAAAVVAPSKQGGLKGSSFIGKRYDASVVWELSKSDKIDDFGRPKFYVNDRLKGERKVGEARPVGLNPAAESIKAEKYLEGGAIEGAGGGDAAPWEAPMDTAPEVPAETAGGFIDEGDVDSLGHAYRAVYKLGGDDSAGAKDTLIGAGIDPEGPVKIELIEDVTLKKAYEAKFGGGAKANGLPPLGKPRTGTRAPTTVR